MSDLFRTLEIEAFRAGITPRTDESREWFRKKAQQIRGVSREKLMKNETLDQMNESVIGSMMMLLRLSKSFIYHLHIAPLKHHSY